MTSTHNHLSKSTDLSKSTESISEDTNLLSQLQSVTDKDVDYFCFTGKHKGKITDCYDGDTCHAVIPFNGKLTKIRVRMLGYNCPEIRDKDPEKKEEAKVAKKIFSDMVLNKIVNLECGDFDKYGRVLGKIIVKDESGKDIDVNEIMISKYGKYMID